MGVLGDVYSVFSEITHNDYLFRSSSILSLGENHQQDWHCKLFITCFGILFSTAVKYTLFVFFLLLQQLSTLTHTCLKVDNNETDCSYSNCCSPVLIIQCHACPLYLALVSFGMQRPLSHLHFLWKEGN